MKQHRQLKTIGDEDQNRPLKDYEVEQIKICYIIIYNCVRIIGRRRPFNHIDEIRLFILFIESCIFNVFYIIIYNCVNIIGRRRPLKGLVYHTYCSI